MTYPSSRLEYRRQYVQANRPELRRKENEYATYTPNEQLDSGDRVGE